jgi:hypothetical protein
MPIDYPQYVFLNIPHNEIGPQAGIEVEFRRKAVRAAEVKQNLPITHLLDSVMTFQHVKVWASDSDVLVKRRWSNGLRVGFNIEGQLF